MNASPSNTPRTAAGSHNPDINSATSMEGWFRDNRNFLIMLAAALTIGLSYNYYMPRRAVQAQQNAWAAFADINATPGGAYTYDALPETLLRARAESKIYPWVVLQGIQDALARADTGALVVLVAEAKILRDNNSLPGLAGENNGVRVAVFDLAIARAEEALEGGNARSFVNPAPDGRSFELTLSDSIDTTYIVRFGLFSESAPLACAAFEELVDSGSMVGRIVGRSGAFGLNMKLLVSDDSVIGVATETSWGFYHLPGSLSFNQKPGEAHLGDSGSLEFTIKDAFHLDGRTTVFAQMTGGIDDEAMAGLQYGGPSGTDTLPALVVTKAEFVN